MVQPLARRTALAVRVDLNISLDGFATTTDQTAEVPFGEEWPRLVGAYAVTRTVRERVFKDRHCYLGQCWRPIYGRYGRTALWTDAPISRDDSEKSSYLRTCGQTGATPPMQSLSAL